VLVLVDEIMGVPRHLGTQVVLVEGMDLLGRQPILLILALVALEAEWVVVVQAVYVFKETVILHIPTQAQEMAQLIHE
jgi:hypothetical protein